MAKILSAECLSGGRRVSNRIGFLDQHQKQGFFLHSTVGASCCPPMHAPPNLTCIQFSHFMTTKSRSASVIEEAQLIPESTNSGNPGTFVQTIISTSEDDAKPDYPTNPPVAHNPTQHIPNQQYEMRKIAHTCLCQLAALNLVCYIPFLVLLPVMPTPPRACSKL